MKLHSLLIVGIIAAACNSNNKTIVTDSHVRVPDSTKETPPQEYIPITHSIKHLDADPSIAGSPSFNGQYVVADKYLVDVKINDSEAVVNWEGFDQVLYQNENCSFKNLICFSSDNPDFGKFYMNARNGKLIHQIIEENDTLYYEVARLNKANKPAGDFNGTYSIIGPKMDSMKFEMIATAPYKYEYKPDSGNKSTVFYRGRDKVGLMHYSNTMAMNSDHMSGLYKWNDDSNATIVQLATN